MEIIITSLLTSILTGSLMGMVLYYSLKPPVKKKRARRSKGAEAMNATVAAANSVVDQQKIRTAEIEVPVIAEDVLEYPGYTHPGDGSLGPTFPEKTKLFYSADAIKDPEFMETVMRSPFQTKTHEGKNTGEDNISIDGMPQTVRWDEDEKRVMAKGVIVGEKNVNYAQENKTMPGFGSSAFISFIDIDRTPGIAPNGKPYDAMVRKAVCNHIALLPNIRDPNNKIVALNAAVVAFNAVKEKKVDAEPSLWVPDSVALEQVQKTAAARDREGFQAAIATIYNALSSGDAHGRNAMPIDKEEFKAAMNEYEAGRKEEAEKIRNAIEEHEKAKTASSGGIVTSTATGGKNTETSTATGTAGNGAESSGPEASAKKEETSTATNAMPSEEMLKDFSTHLGVTFPKAPTLVELGALNGIKATDPAELITALNAKRAEFKQPAAAQNGGLSIMDALNQI